MRNGICLLLLLWLGPPVTAEGLDEWTLIDDTPTCTYDAFDLVDAAPATPPIVESPEQDALDILGERGVSLQPVAVEEGATLENLRRLYQESEYILCSLTTADAAREVIPTSIADTEYEAVEELPERYIDFPEYAALPDDDDVYEVQAVELLDVTVPPPPPAAPACTVDPITGATSCGASASGRGLVPRIVTAPVRVGRRFISAPRRLIGRRIQARRAASQARSSQSSTQGRVVLFAGRSYRVQNGGWYLGKRVSSRWQSRPRLLPRFRSRGC